MIYTPETQRGSFFNDQEREVRSVQWVQSLSLALDKGRGSHLFKFGLDFQDSRLQRLECEPAGRNPSQ